jgi:hypothetical protein
MRPGDPVARPLFSFLFPPFPWAGRLGLLYMCEALPLPAAWPEFFVSFFAVLTLLVCLIHITITIYDGCQLWGYTRAPRPRVPLSFAPPPRCGLRVGLLPFFPLFTWKNLLI